MPLTQTSHLTHFTRPPPSAVTFAFPPPRTSSSDISPTLITFCPGSTLTTQLHWHTTHTEYLHILHGAALITLSNVTKIYTKEDGIVDIPRYARHEWMRFDRPALQLSQVQQRAQVQWMCERGEDSVREYGMMDLVAEEWTHPSDGQKEIFFRNLFSTAREPLYDSSIVGWVYREVQILCVMWELDNYPVLIDFEGWRGGWREWVEAGFTYGILGLAAGVGMGLGLRAVREEYTPEWLREKWEGAGRREGVGSRRE